ncbi:type 1 fimbrial protein [Pseudomonas sp. 15FMM2]|uniref:Type 1 fimbrial protein n=1 Tax=Pseudomonas imrae TaxID=2992837 RepID=A0ACC7PJ62_9PSED
MIIQRPAVGISVLFALVSTSSLAETPVGTGVIHFQGSIVEPACQANRRAGSSLTFSGCPSFARAATVSARSVEPVHAVSKPDGSVVNMKLVLETTGDGRYFNRQFTLSDATGKPLHSGAYLVTLAYP